MAPEPKRRKFIPPPHKSKIGASGGASKEGDEAAAAIGSGFTVSSSSIVDPRIEQGKNMAVVQAQRDGCRGNYRIMDSPFGNFLLPVLPTRAELLSG